MALLLLQRGRAPESAESASGRIALNQTRSLQRGRAPESAESAITACRESLHESLQRGRAPESAESKTLPPRKSARGRFNGAALRRARSHFPCILRTSGRVASTGPRSGERGVGTLASDEAGASQKPLCERRAPCGSRARIASLICFVRPCLSVCERPGARFDHARARVLAVKKQAVLSGDHGVTPHNTAGRKYGRPGPAR